MTTPCEAAVYAWARMTCDRPMPLIERRRIIGERMMISEVRLSPGFRVATHSHENEQFAVVLSGKVKFGIGAEGSPARREHILSGGEVIHFPSNVPHSAEAIEETMILDLFSPISERTGVDAHTAMRG